MEDWRGRVRKLARPRAAQDVARRIMHLVEERMDRSKEVKGGSIEDRIPSNIR